MSEPTRYDALGRVDPCGAYVYVDDYERKVAALTAQLEAAREREAPADLVALVTEWQAAERAVRLDEMTSMNELISRELAAYEALRAWRPSPPGERPKIRVGDVLRADGADGFVELGHDEAVEYWRRPENASRVTDVYRAVGRKP